MADVAQKQAAAKKPARAVPKAWRGYEDDPRVQAFLNAPVDDEPLEPEDIAAIARSEAYFKAGGKGYDFLALCDSLGISGKLK